MKPIARAWSILLVASSFFGGCTPKSTSPPTVVAAAPSADPVGVKPVVDEDGRTYQIQQGRVGDPSVLGCADGQREAFVDDARFPSIAGCAGRWAGSVSLRTPASGAGCGDDGADCGSPADVCAPGWHLCGSDGSLAELRAIAPTDCENAGGGRFAAAVSHCRTQDGCEYDDSASARYSCFESGWCSEPVCCGTDCGELGMCTGGVWADRTHIPMGQDHGCGSMVSSRAGGLLCCR
ncbi:MAG: hypothetical protein U0230_10880 [Polyangiales bacterium]